MGGIRPAGAWQSRTVVGPGRTDRAAEGWTHPVVKIISRVRQTKIGGGMDHGEARQGDGTCCINMVATTGPFLPNLGQNRGGIVNGTGVFLGILDSRPELVKTTGSKRRYSKLDPIKRPQ